jgi:hypothetical protein
MTDDIEQRLNRLESIVTDQHETIQQLRERIAQLEAGIPTGTNHTVPRRTALQAGGMLALLGVGAGTASADSRGQVGTSSDPLRTLFTTELDGPVTGGTALTNIAGSGLSIQNGRLTGTGVSDDGTSVAAGVTDINFGSGLGVANDGDGTVTVGFPPTITGFALTNPSAGNLQVSFDASRQLGTIAVEITDSGGNTVTTLTEGDFTESCATSSCAYTVIYEVSTSDTYTATLTTAEGESGIDGATGQSDTATVDPLTITGFGMTNPSGEDLKILFDASRQLGTIAVEITDSGGNTVTTLTEGDFTESCATSSCAYTVIYEVSTSDTYTATLTTAEGESGIDGATGQSDTATVVDLVAYADVSDGTPRRLNPAGTVQDYATSKSGSGFGPPTTDITSDGMPELPIVDGGNVVLVDIDGNTRTLDDSGSVKGRGMGVGDWNDDGRVEVVYIRSDSSNTWYLYSVAPGRSPTKLGFEEPRDVAVGDFDGDESQEIIFSNYDGSNRNIVYSSDGNTTTDTNSDGGRLGTPADFDDDGSIEIATESEADIVLVEADGTTTTLSTSHPVAPSPMGALDYTGTGVPDIIHTNDYTGGSVTTDRDIWYYDVVNGNTGPVKDASGTTLRTNISTGTR